MIMSNTEKINFDVELEIAEKEKEKDYKAYLDNIYELFMTEIDPKIDTILEWYKKSNDSYLYDDIIRELLFKLYLESPKKASQFVLEDFEKAKEDTEFHKEQLKLNF